MKGRHISVVMGAVLGMSVIGSGVATADDTGVTVRIQGGPLFISVPGTADLGTVTQSLSGVTIVGQLGVTTVEDNRGDNNGAWDVFAQSTDFVRDDGNATISATRVGYQPGQIDTVGTVSMQGIDRDNIANAPNVVKATGIVGVNSGSWNPTLLIPLPSDVLSGTYNATISQSVS